MSHQHPIRHHATHTSAIFVAIGIGMALGHFYPQHDGWYKRIAHLYLTLLEMSVLPVMSAAVITSLGNLFHQGSTWYYLKRMIIVFVVGMLVASGVAILLGHVIAPGERLSEESIAVISQALPMTDEHAEEGPAIDGPWALVEHMIPENIFGAMARGQMLPVLFVSILFGIALGIQSTAASRHTINILRAIYNAFTRIIGWVMIGLPLGMCFLFADYVSQTGLKIFEALTWSIVSVLCGFLIMILIYAAVISYATRQMFGRAFIQLRAPIFLGFFTASSLMTIPTMLETLSSNFKVDRNVVDLAIPLSVSLNRQSAMIRFILTAIFLAQLYGKPLEFSEIPVMILMAVMASMAGAGTPAIASISMAGMIFLPLGLPVAVGITIMHATEPLIDPLATVVNVMASCASSILIAKHRKETDSDTLDNSGEEAAQH